jgi:hypothetical protein
MPVSWGDVLKELQQVAASGQPLPPGVSPLDVLRRQYLTRLHQATNRNVILYATKWTQAPTDPDSVSIVAEDLPGFMEVLTELDLQQGLDLVLHSPGGSGEAAESLVKYLRAYFTDVRVIVPHAAMSAATMLACSANRILMGTHSFLGPIDPQFIMQQEGGGRIAVAAHAILAQFALAKKECADPTLLPAWIPMLRQYGPALLVQCQLAQDLSRSLVAEWLEQYMLKDDADKQAKAQTAATALSDHANFKSHGRFIDRNQARSIGLVVDDLESDPAVENGVLGLFHSTSHTFNATAAVKLLENLKGRAFIKLAQIVQVQSKARPVAPQPAPAPPAPAPPQVPVRPPPAAPPPAAAKKRP